MIPAFEKRLHLLGDENMELKTENNLTKNKIDDKD